MNRFRLPALSPALLAVSVIAAACTPAAADPASTNWPQFRGPGSAGLAALAPGDLPAKFTEKDFRWNVPIAGVGYGSPVVWGEKAFLLTCDEKIGLGRVVCVSVADGRIIWNKDYRLGAFKHNKDNSMAASTPAVDASRVVVCWTSAKAVTVVALDHAGKQVWQHSLGAHKTSHGPCCTPILYEGTVYVANDNQGPSALLAIDAASGKVKWQVKRTSGKAAYGTPLIYRPAGGAPQLVVSSTAGGLTGYDLKTGKQLWIAADANPQRVVASPVQAGDLIVSSSGTGGRGKWLIAVKPPASSGGQVQTVWKNLRDAPYVPTSVAVGGLLFVVTDTGGLACHRAATGEVVWKDKLPERFYGSPVCAGGKIYVIGRKGTMFCYAAAEKFELLGETPLGEASFATPAFAGTRMLLRTHSRLICVEKKN